MNNRFFSAVLTILAATTAQAQFCTITKGTPIEAPSPYLKSQQTNNKTDTVSIENFDSISAPALAGIDKPFAYTRKRNVRKPRRVSNTGSGSIINRKTAAPRVNGPLPKLTIPNLMAEIERNGILYPDIVLAQAILETGWFTSHVCLHKNNLFGLTNPRTGEYYEFGHWTESVEAYYSKVQYRYKGGNYLKWLNKIGYAEAPDYVRSLIRILKQLRG